MTHSFGTSSSASTDSSSTRRHATDEEAALWHRRVRAVRWTRGFDLLWKDVRFVQELSFDALIPVRFGAMPHARV